MTVLTVATANVYTANPRPSALAEALEDSGADVIGLQEGWWLSSLAGFTRLRVDALAGRGGLEVPIFLARDLEYHGHGGYFVHHEIKGSKVAKERWVTWCRFVKQSHRVALVDAHLNAALQEPDGDIRDAKRVDLAAAHMRAIVREVRAQRAAGYLPFVTADFNYLARPGQRPWRWSPDRALARAGLHYVHHRIDGIGYPNNARPRTVEPLTLPGSDHTGLRLSLELPGRRVTT